MRFNAHKFIIDRKYIKSNKSFVYFFFKNIIVHNKIYISKRPDIYLYNIIISQCYSQKAIIIKINTIYRYFLIKYLLNQKVKYIIFINNRK